MTSDDDLRDLVAAALRGDGPWDSLSEFQKNVWRADAERAIKAIRSAATTGADVVPVMRALSNEEHSLLMQALCDRGPGEIIQLPPPAGESVTPDELWDWLENHAFKSTKPVHELLCSTFNITRKSEARS